MPHKITQTSAFNKTIPHLTVLSCFFFFAVLGALLWKIEFAQRQGLTGESCTDRSALWNRGTRRNVVPAQVGSMEFRMEKMITDVTAAHGKVTVPHYNTHEEYVKAMRESVIAPLLDVKGSLLHQTVSVTTLLPLTAATPSEDVHTSHKSPDLSCNVCGEFYEKWVRIKESARARLANLTMQQKGKLWQCSRKLRLTASNISKIPRKKDTPPDKFIQSCLFSHFRGNKATSHGNRFEPVARQAFEKLHNLTVERCGTVVSETHPFLSASPDGLIGMDSIIKIKCPYTDDCVELINSNKYDVRKDAAGYHHLSKAGKNGYYFQVQFVMFCLQRSNCYFFVWSALNSVLIVVPYDKEFIIAHITRITEFYFMHYLPRLVQAVRSKSLVLCDEYVDVCSQY